MYSSPKSVCLYFFGRVLPSAAAGERFVRLWTAWLGGMVGVSIAGFVSPTLHSCQDTDIDQGSEDEEIHTEAL